MASGSLEREYESHLAALGQLRDQLVAEGGPVADHDEAVTQFVLHAGPILARAAAGGHNAQTLYEELATLTNNTEALRRIKEAKLRREDAKRAAFRHPNGRKKRDRQPEWSQEDLTCAVCGSSLIIMEREATLVCPQCGLSRTYLDTSANALAFGERAPSSESSYSRQTHLSELLAQVQGIEQTDVPDQVVSAVRKELQKHRQLDDPRRVSPDLVRHHLKRLHMSKWYDNAMQLAIIVTSGRCRRLRLPPALVQDLHDSFRQAQEPFARGIQGTRRRNFFSYCAFPISNTPRAHIPSATHTRRCPAGYFCHKRCQINGFDAYAKFFKLLKSREKYFALSHPRLNPSPSSCSSSTALFVCMIRSSPCNHKIKVPASPPQVVIRDFHHSRR